jgi:putative DNA methylase
MMWVYAESNPFSTSSGNIIGQLDYLTKTLAALPARGVGVVHQQDAAQLAERDVVYSTDPPYYDNVPYADLSDFFYVWHRQVLHNVLPDLYSTLLTPKAPELIAEPARAGSWAAAASFFEQGLRRVFDRMTADNAADFPFTIYYAFKQSETDDEGTASTGWETMLQALVDSGATITATWPVRTELAGGLRELGRNALATSVVLACRRRESTSARTDRRGLVAALDAGLPERLRQLQQGRISPVDLEQAAIGPGMAIFTSFASVLNDDGTPMRVRTALQLINRVVDSVLRQEDSDYDDDTKFAVVLFRHFGLEPGPFGDATTFARKMASSLDHLERAGVLTARANKVTLLGPANLDPSWDPSSTPFLSEWAVVLHLSRALSDVGVVGASALLTLVPATIDRDLCKELAFLLFKLAGDLKQTKVALDFNALGTAWTDIVAGVGPTAEQGTFDYTGD